MAHTMAHTIIPARTNSENTVMQTKIPGGGTLSTIIKSGGVMGHVGETILFTATGETVDMPDCKTTDEHDLLACLLCA